jgi:hypothetical protein
MALAAGAPSEGLLRLAGAEFRADKAKKAK